MADLANYAAAIIKAREDAGRARVEYSKGRVGTAAVSRADRALADAHSKFRECSGGNVPDNR